MTFVYREDLVDEACREENERPVTDIDREMENRPLYHAVQERDGVVWRATIDSVDTREEYDSDPSVKFAKCYPESDRYILKSWTSLATGRNPGPQDLESWEALFTVFNAVLQLYRYDLPQEVSA